jgi:hypothetical protein
LMVQNLENASREFFARTAVWEEDLDAADLVAEQTDYSLITPHDARIERLTAVRVNTTDGVAAGLPGTLVNERLYSFSPDEDGGTLSFDTAPQASVTEGLDAKVIYVPHMGPHADLPQWLMNRYADAIVSGALARLKRLPWRDWADPAGAAEHMIIWRRGICTAKREKLLKHKGTEPTVLEM